MSFCTAINCMDGRVQLPVIAYLRERFNVQYVDSITEPGPNAILATQTDPHAIKSILARVRISLEHHGSIAIAVVGHHGCAGNPASEEEQADHTRDAVRTISLQFPDIAVIGLWVDENWEVSEVSA